jgi:hypothetical protein
MQKTAYTSRNCHMRTLARGLLVALSVVFIAAACGGSPSPAASGPASTESLVGAWRAQIHFTGGGLADMKGLEFMYVFNAAGTMTESSNYDAAPPVPPAYGTWSASGPRQFEARYEFYITRPPATFEEIAKGGGWLPGGRGVLTEKMTLSEDGRSYKSTITYAPFDQDGKPVAGGGEGTAEGKRMGP